MNPTAFRGYINAFVEDTCVLACFAYLVGRSRMLRWVFKPERSRAFIVGAVLGLFGATEAVFPGSRSPYLTSSLVISFGLVTGGVVVAGIATSVVIAAFLLSDPIIAVPHAASYVAGVLALYLLQGMAEGKPYVRAALVTTVGQLATMAAWKWLPHSIAVPWVSVPANLLGVLVILVVTSEAKAQIESAERLLELQRALTLVRDAELRELRATMRPHFLFNSLTSIAALCGFAPDKAESAILALAAIMRSSIESAARSTRTVGEELEIVRSHCEILQHRLGPRLTIEYDVDPESMEDRMPPFSVQTLVENAVEHGIARRRGPGTVRVRTRVKGRRTLVGVRDDGAGFDPRIARTASPEGGRPHGLQIVSSQLSLLFGQRSRLRVFSQPGHGSLVTFSIPHGDLDHSTKPSRR